MQAIVTHAPPPLASHAAARGRSMTAVPALARVATEGRRTVDAIDEQRLLERGLVGSPAEARALVAYLVPVVQARVGRVLAAVGGSRRRNLREEVEDMTQDVFGVLFEHDARVLRAWSADRGLSLRNFVGLVARRRCHAVLAVRKRNPWYEEPLEDAAVERALPEAASAEARLAARQVIDEALRRTAAEQSERGVVLLELIFKDGLDNPELVARTGMTEAAVYQWRSRLTKTLRRHVADLTAERGGASHEP